VLLLDGWLLLARPDLRAGEEALRRWLNAAALARPGGRVVIMASSPAPPVQALLRWAPFSYAERELTERTALHLPPTARLAALTGPPDAVRELVELTELPATAEVLGPVPVPGARLDEDAQERMLVRAPRREAAALAAALKAAAAIRSARKSGPAVRVELDPIEVG
jgi:primosomal protein N' (replication factor Y)